jgi:lysophospholipase L1-like esterase
MSRHLGARSPRAPASRRSSIGSPVGLGGTTSTSSQTDWDRNSVADLTVSGATTATIVERFRVLIRKLPPQLVGLPRDADLVTITAGGNDLRYRELIYI